LNYRLWHQLFWGYPQSPDSATTTCYAMIGDLHDTLYGLRAAETDLRWYNDSILTFETWSEWLGSYSSTGLHRASVRRSGGDLLDLWAWFDDAALQRIRFEMLKFRKKAVRKHLRELKKNLSRSDKRFLRFAGICDPEEIPLWPEAWLDDRGFCVKLDCDPPHAVQSWGTTITYVIQWSRLNVIKKHTP